MSTVLLAVGDAALRRACRSQLQAAGYAALTVDRPLALLSLASRLRWDALCLDDSELGRDTLAVAQLSDVPAALLGLGIDTQAGQRIELPLGESDLLTALAAGLDLSPRLSLRLDVASHRVLLDDREAHLSDIEFRIFRLLYERRPGEVPVVELLAAIWGAAGAPPADGGGLRVHVHNLRGRLAAIGLSDAVQSRRGRGYALVL